MHDVSNDSDVITFGRGLPKRFYLRRALPGLSCP